MQLVRKRPPQISAAAGATVEFSILRQDVDFTKLPLKLLDSLDAIRVPFSGTLGRDGRLAPIAWCNRNRD